MAIIKCKMCGGDMELSADKTFGTCEYCGSTMTLPKAADEQRAAAFNRGNHFRRIGEFDKALAVYERIVQENDADAEAHWCCMLCRFGIEYVEDPTTYEWVPTCHRASFDSVLEDVDYLAAVEYSDGITRRQYQKDAAKIADVQKGILATSQNEQPFDVFICYKETDRSGERTRDSLLAQEIYYQLTEQGRRVFFARITLEDKIGTQYEPYIFAALHSSRVMIVVGTSEENLNAVWVKNEWSRFLRLMKQDRTKLLLPCYRDMDPYDLPEQLSVLQSYDMGKIGFMQDLTRGISKVLDADKKPEPVQTVQQTVVQQNAAGNMTALLKRGIMALEDGEWNKADEFFEEVLNQDAECAQAYLGKLMAGLRVREQEDLKNCAHPFDGNRNYQKVLRFADAALRAELEGCIRFIQERNEHARLLGLYNDASAQMTDAKTEADFKAAAEAFGKIPGFQDADAQKQKCIELAEEARLEAIHQAECDRKDRVYNQATKREPFSHINQIEEAIAALETIPDWRDAGSKLIQYRQLLETRKAQAIHAKQLREAEEKEAARISKRNTIIVLIVVALCVLVLAAILFIKEVIIPSGEYEDAQALMAAGNYEEAMQIFDQLEDYEDAETQYAEAFRALKAEYRKQADAALIAGDRVQAAILYTKAGDHAYATQVFDFKTRYAVDEYVIAGIMQDGSLKYQSNLKYDDAEEAIADLEGVVKLVAHTTDGINGLTAAGELRMHSLGMFDEIDVRDSMRLDLYNRQITQVVHGIQNGYYVALLKEDGTVVCVCEEKQIFPDVGYWKNICYLEECHDYLLGLDTEGRVHIAYAKGVNNYKFDVSGWPAVSHVYVFNRDLLIGLTTDQRLVVTSKEHDQTAEFLTSLTGVVDLKTFYMKVNTEGKTVFAVLMDDGKVKLFDKEGNPVEHQQIASWREVVKLELGVGGSLIGITHRGTIECYDEDDADLAGWTDIVSIQFFRDGSGYGSCYDFAVGVRADGTVVTTSDGTYTKSEETSKNSGKYYKKEYTNGTYHLVDDWDLW